MAPEAPEEGKMEATGSRAGDAAGSVFLRTAPSPPAEPDWGTLKNSLGDLGKEKSFEPIKDFKGLAESFVNSQKMLGKAIFLPDEKLSPEERKKAIEGIKKKLISAGALEKPPETPDDYQLNFPTVDRFGKELKPNQPLIDSFKQIAHKTGLTPAAAQGLVDWYLNFQAEVEAEEDHEFEKMKAELKKNWGGLYTRRMEASRRAIAKYLGDDGDDILSSLPPATGKRIVMAFSQIGEPLLEEALITGQIPGVTTEDSVKKEIDAIVANKDHPLWDVTKPGHDRAVEEWTKLQQLYIALTSKKK